MEPEYWKRAIIKLKKEDVILKSVIEQNQKNIFKIKKRPLWHSTEIDCWTTNLSQSGGEYI